MADMKGMIIFDGLESVHLRYRIPKNVKLSTPREGETHRDHCDGCVTFARKWNMKIVSNLSDSTLEWKLQFFYARFKETSVALEELDLGQITNLVKGAFTGGSRAYPSLELQQLLLEKTRRSAGAVKIFDRGVACVSPTSSRSSNASRGVPEEKKGPTALDEEEERLARQEKVDLQVGPALSHEEARSSGLIVISPKTSMGPAPLGLASSSVPMVNVEGDITSPIPTFEREPSKASDREDTEVRVTDE
ncbi:hypothetical protein ACLOJK_006933 [Asimina triloba]